MNAKPFVRRSRDLLVHLYPANTAGECDSGSPDKGTDSGIRPAFPCPAKDSRPAPFGSRRGPGPNPRVPGFSTNRSGSH